MKITRLPKSGLWIQSGSTNVVIDPLKNISERMISLLGKPHETIMELSGNIGNTYVFITRIHPDHFELETVNYLINDFSTSYARRRSTPDLPPGSARKGSRQRPSSHLFYFHGGDMGWYRYWLKLVKSFGSFDTVFLPVNGITGGCPAFKNGSYAQSG